MQNCGPPRPLGLPKPTDRPHPGAAVVARNTCASHPADAASGTVGRNITEEIMDRRSLLLGGAAAPLALTAASATAQVTGEKGRGMAAGAGDRWPVLCVRKDIVSSRRRRPGLASDGICCRVKLPWTHS